MAVSTQKNVFTVIRRHLLQSHHPFPGRAETTVPAVPLSSSGKFYSSSHPAWTAWWALMEHDQRVYFCWSLVTDVFIKKIIEVLEAKHIALLGVFNQINSKIYRELVSDYIRKEFYWQKRISAMQNWWHGKTKCEKSRSNIVCQVLVQQPSFLTFNIFLLNHNLCDSLFC